MTTITATDIDDGDFGTVHYILAGTDTDDGAFKINRTTVSII